MIWDARQLVRRLLRWCFRIISLGVVEASLARNGGSLLGGLSSIRVVAYQDSSDGKLWTAQGLEYDLRAQGKDVEEAIEGFKKLLEYEVNRCNEIGIDPLSDILPAAGFFHELWDSMESERVLH